MKVPKEPNPDRASERATVKWILAVLAACFALAVLSQFVGCRQVTDAVGFSDLPSSRPTPGNPTPPTIGEVAEEVDARLLQLLEGLGLVLLGGVSSSGISAFNRWTKARKKTDV